MSDENPALARFREALLAKLSETLGLTYDELTGQWDSPEVPGGFADGGLIEPGVGRPLSLMSGPEFIIPARRIPTTTKLHQLPGHPTVNIWIDPRKDDGEEKP